MRPIRRATLVILVALGAASGVTRAEPSAPTTGQGSPETLTVAVSLPPMAGLVAPLLTGRARPSILARPADGVHGAELAPAAVHLALTADLLVYASDSAEPAMARLARLRALAGRPSVALADTDHADDHTDHSHAASDDHPWLDPARVEALLPGFADRLADAGLPISRDGLHSIARDAREVVQAFGVLDHALDGWRCVSVHGALDAALADAGVDLLPPIVVAHHAGVSPGALARLAASARANPRLMLLLDSPLPTGVAARLRRGFAVRIVPVETVGSEDWERLMRENLRAILDAALTAPTPIQR